MANKINVDPTDAILDAIEKDQSAISTIKYDKFWDGAMADSIRSSSDADPSKYYDPSSAYKEKDGRPLSSLIPSRGGLSGVIVPRAKRFGGSMGWDPHKAQIVNIDPYIAGQSSVVDLSKITKESVDAAMASTANIADPRLAASVAFRRISVGTEPINMPEPKSKVQDDYHPMAMAGAYITPKASLGGGQEKRSVAKLVASPIQVEGRKMEDREAQEIENALFEEAVKERNGGEVNYLAAIGGPPRQEVHRAALFNKKSEVKEFAKDEGGYLDPVSNPAETVTYEVEGFGHLTSTYHVIVREGINLVLVSDKRWKGQKFTPQQNDEKPLIVDVHSHPNVYKVISPGIKFNLFNWEICILFIVDEAKKE